MKFIEFYKIYYRSNDLASYSLGIERDRCRASKRYYASTDGVIAISCVYIATKCKNTWSIRQYCNYI